jgi:hypothetical protein
MSYFEFGPCKLPEYEDYKEKRIIEDLLNVYSLYTAVFKMKRADGKPFSGSVFELEAYKLHARILNKKEAGKFGLHIVNFAIVDAQQEELGTSRMNLLDGFLTDPTGVELLIGGPDPENPSHATVDYTTSLGFFKDYEGNSGNTDKASSSEEADINDEVSVVLDRELVLV